MKTVCDFLQLSNMDPLSLIDSAGTSIQGLFEIAAERVSSPLFFLSLVCKRIKIKLLLHQVMLLLSILSVQ
jgi:hypothetical protein